MKIGIDVMGGDYAPDAIIEGASLALKELDNSVSIVFIGDEKQTLELTERYSVDKSRFELIPSYEVIKMGEHPAKAFAKKTKSSISIGFGLLSKGYIQSFASAGSTGAMLVGSMYTVKSVPGVIRPAITSILPRINYKPGVLLDVGINPDCKPEILYQYGIFGSIYSKNVYGIDNPRVGLLNIGEEEEKGNIMTKAAFEMMKGTKDFNFVGNVEGHDLFSSKKADVFVCDGFVGNIVLKQAESMYYLLKARGIEDEYFNTFNFETYGGTPVLGINSNVLIAHGASTTKAIKNLLLLSKNLIDAKLTDKFKEIFKDDEN